MVWMRLSAFPSFDKLYAIVQEELEPATYFMKIENNFDVSEFNGTKAFHISTVQWFGAGNVFLGTIYLVVGVAALFIAIILLVNHIVNPRAPSNDPAVLLRDCLERLEMD